MRKKAKNKRIREIRQIQKIKTERKKWQITAQTDFQPDYCQMLITHMSQGFSFHSFAAVVNVLPETLIEWTEKYPEFSHARNAAELRQKMFWEKKAIEACSDKFSISVFRYFTGTAAKDLKPQTPEAVVILPEEESKEEKE